MYTVVLHRVWDEIASGIVLSVITEFCSECRTTIDGNTNDLSLNELSGGACIRFVFHELFNNGLRGSTMDDLGRGTHGMQYQGSSEI